MPLFTVPMWPSYLPAFWGKVTVFALIRAPPCGLHLSNVYLDHEYWVGNRFSNGYLDHVYLWWCSCSNEYLVHVYQRHQRDPESKSWIHLQVDWNSTVHQNTARLKCE